MAKDKAIFFGIIGVVVILLIVYISVAFGNKSEVVGEQTAFESPDFEKKKQDYNNRLESLMKENYDNPERDNPLRYDFLEEEAENDTNHESEEIKKPKEKTTETKPIQRKNTPRKTSPKSSSVNPPAAESNQKENPPKADQQEVEVRYAFSTSSSNLSASEPSSGIKKSVNTWAQLEEKSIIKEYSHQVFLLEQGATIQGRYFPANSKLFTKTFIEGDYIDIRVHRIKDSNSGEEFDVNMFAMNEDRSRGIKYKGKVNKESDQTKGTVLSETMEILYRRNRGNDVAEAAGEGAEEMVINKDVEISIAKGYRLIFVENNE